MTHDNATPPPGARAAGAFVAISFAASTGRAPAPEAVKILAEYWEQWLAGDGQRTFDAVLGFAGERGRAPFLERVRAQLRDLFLCHQMAVLCAGGFNETEAAEVVSTAVNRSPDPLYRKQLRQLRAHAPAQPKKRKGATLVHLPAKSVLRIFNERHEYGGLTWAKLAGYFGDCEERRQLASAVVDDSNETKSFYRDLEICGAFPFRSVEQIARAIPLDELPPALAARLRAK